MSYRANSEWENEPDLDQLRRCHGLLQSNSAEAMRDLEILSSRGSAMSMHYMAEAYRTGIGARMDVREAERWYERAVEAGLVRSSHRLGVLYRQNHEYRKAVEAFGIGVKNGFPPSMNILGQMFLQGQGVESDTRQARELWTRAAADGHLWAKRNLSFLMMSGRCGIFQVPVGIFIWLSALIDIPFIVATDPNSDRMLGVR